MKEYITIRVKTLAWIEHNNNLFVVKMHDSVKADDYYRPPGGSVEFGETTSEALHRELKEELGTSITINGSPLVLENLFTCNGEMGHEIDFLYPASFNDKGYYKMKNFDLKEANSETYEASWISIERCLNGEFRLVPEALLNWYRTRQ